MCSLASSVQHTLQTPQTGPFELSAAQHLTPESATGSQSEQEHGIQGGIKGGERASKGDIGDCPMHKLTAHTA